MSNLVRWVLGVDKNDDSDNADYPASNDQDQDSSPELSAEEIRRKRLERFQKASNADSPQDNNSSTQHSNAQLKEKPTVTSFPSRSESHSNAQSSTPKQTPKSESSSNTTTKPQERTPSKPKGQTQSPKSKSAPSSEKSPQAHAKPSPKSKSSTPSKYSPEEKYVNEIVSRLFKVSLIPSSSSSTTTSYVYLEDLAQSKSAKLFSMDDLDFMIMERSKKHSISLFNYLVQCYSRTHIELSELSERKKKKVSTEFRKDILTKVQQFIMEYCALYILHPESFDPLMEGMGIQMGVELMLKQMLLPPDNDGYIPFHFLTTFVSHHPKMLKSVFEPLFSLITKKVKKASFMGTEWFPLLSCMDQLTKIPETARILAEHPDFIPPAPQNQQPTMGMPAPKGMTGKIMEQKSILGPFFSLHATDQRAAEHYFGGGNTLNLKRSDVSSSINLLQRQHKTVQDGLRNVLLNLLRKKDCRPFALKWIGTSISSNETRNRMRDDMMRSSSDGFMYNLGGVLLRLCEPFLDKRDENGKIKTDKIDGRYPTQNKIVPNFNDDTRLIFSPQESKDFSEKLEKEDKDVEFSFVTSCYFLTIRAIHLGYVKSMQKFSSKLKQHSELQRVYDRLKQSGQQANPMEMTQLENRLTRLWINRWSNESQLLDTNFLKLLFRYNRFTCTFLLKQLDIPRDLSNIPADIKEHTPLYSSFPEFFIEDIFDEITFLGRLKPESLNAGEYDELLILCIGYLKFGHLTKNPYIRAKVPELLVLFTPQPQSASGTRRLLVDHPLTKTHLMSGLMRLYVDMESTGGSNQFYDKFTPRFWIAVVMKSLWEYDYFREAFKRESQSSEPHNFMKFFNMLLNDANFLLDESLKTLKEIHDYEDDLKHNRIAQDQLQERTQEVQRSTPALQSYMMLAKETVNMMHYLSRDFPDPFLRPEMISRVASMLNYFLIHLAGDECQNLKVQNPEKYHFNPKQLITQLTETYMHFSKYDEFIKAVASDERSYKPDVLSTKVPKILSRIGTCTKKFIQDFENFGRLVNAKSMEMAVESEDFGDAPDEFLDGITYSLMDDPVELPSSGVILDRSTIERHLLNDATDPFNRDRLEAKDLIPKVDLKKQIEEWKASKKRKM